MRSQYVFSKFFDLKDTVLTKVKTCGNGHQNLFPGKKVFHTEIDSGYLSTHYMKGNIAGS